jgi:hypothetical protein
LDNDENTTISPSLPPRILVHLSKEAGREFVCTAYSRPPFIAAQEQTEVDIEFVPAAAGTLVTVTHRGLSDLRADHPARHGLQGADFSRMIGLWWGAHMNSLREVCAARRS